MPTDSEGLTWGTGSAVWCDDGASPDWQHGTVTGVNIPSVPAGKAKVQLDNTNVVVIFQRWVHVGKPNDPPDHV